MVPHVQLLSLSMMFSGLVHVVTVSRLRLIAREYPTVQIPHTFLTHLMDIWVVSTFWLTSGLFPLFGSYGQCRCDHLRTRFGCTCVFIPLGYALLDHSMFNDSRNRQTVLHSSCTGLYSISSAEGLPLLNGPQL